MYAAGFGQRDAVRLNDWRVTGVFTCIMVRTLVGVILCGHGHAEDTGPAVSETICPFAVEVYPAQVLAGDTVYARITYENTSEHAAWAPLTPLHWFVPDTIYFTFERVAEPKMSWQRNVHGFFVGHTVWGLLEPGEKGLVQYETIETPGSPLFMYLSLRPEWKEIETKGSTGFLGVTVLTAKSRTAEAPVGMRRDVTCPTEITITPRPADEAAMLQSLFQSKKYRTTAQYRHNVLWPDSSLERLAPAELQHVIDKMSPGTLRNRLELERRLLTVRESSNDAERIGRLWQLSKWLETLPEIEREALKQEIRELNVRSPAVSEEVRQAHTEFFGVWPWVGCGAAGRWGDAGAGIAGLASRRSAGSDNRKRTREVGKWICRLTCGFRFACSSGRPL